MTIANLSSPTLDRLAASNLHAYIGGLGIRDHYRFAADVLGRAVESFLTLTRDEVRALELHLEAELRHELKGDI